MKRGCFGVPTVSYFKCISRVLQLQLRPDSFRILPGDPRDLGYLLVRSREESLEAPERFQQGVPLLGSDARNVVQARVDHGPRAASRVESMH